MSQRADIQSQIDAVAARLAARLGANLCSCMLYGSAARGEMLEPVSDVNLLIVLQESTPAAHLAISESTDGPLTIDSFVIGRRGLQRSVRVFAPKFVSIRRNYRLLQGEDCLADLQIDTELKRFLCEQAVRNLCLRVVHAYIETRKQPERYSQFVKQVRTPIVVQLSEALRIFGVEVPQKFADQLPVIQKEMNLNVSVLRKLGASRLRRRPFTLAEIEQIHSQLYPLLDRAILWMEDKWPNP